MLTLIPYPVYIMLLLSPIISYMMTTPTISGEKLPPYYSLSHDINVIGLNMHPCTWMRVTKLQQPIRHLFLALVYPFFNFFLKVIRNLDNMANVKCFNLTGIEAWTYGLIFQSNSRQKDRITCLDLDHFPRVLIWYISFRFFVFFIS